MLTRRSFLKAGSSTLILSSRPLSAQGGAIKRYSIIASKASHRLGRPGTSPTPLWLYNGQSPGPLIEANRGDTLEVAFTNNLEVPTTIHWHGIRNLNEMDGVPDLTQSAVEPGKTFTYSFPLHESGTYWYHAHTKGWEQMARGLYGALVVKEKRSKSANDIVLVADDWRLTEDYKLDEDSFGSLRDWSHQGRLGNWLTINGSTEPIIDVSPGVARLRLINAANARSLNFRLGNNQRPEIVALDGAPCDPFKVDTIKLAPAQRVDLLLELNDEEVKLEEVSTGDVLPAAYLKVSGNALPPIVPTDIVRDRKPNKKDAKARKSRCLDRLILAPPN